MGLPSLKRYAESLLAKMAKEDIFRNGTDWLPEQQRINGLHLEKREELSQVTSTLQTEMDLVADLRGEVDRLEDALVARKKRVRESDAKDDVKMVALAVAADEDMLTARRLRLRERESQLISSQNSWRRKLCDVWGAETIQFSEMQQQLWISLGNITAYSDYQSVVLDALEGEYERRSGRTKR